MLFVGAGTSAGRVGPSGGASAVPGGHRAVLPGIGGEGESLLPSVDPLCKRVAPGGVNAVAGVASDRGPAVFWRAVPRWGGLAGAGLLWRRRGGRAYTVPGGGGGGPWW